MISQRASLGASHRMFLQAELHFRSNFLSFLALLGQGFTNTFLSQSISVCDWIVFACVPTGVPFALTAIIRVSRRNGFLRGLFTYPEEENRFIERDLLSSTSEEVCEIWNGRGVTRQFAPLSQLPVTEWIFDGTLMRSAEAKNHILFKKGTLRILFLQHIELTWSRGNGYCCSSITAKGGES